MTDRYLNYDGLRELSQYINGRLRIVTVMPNSPNINDIVLYNGATTGNYIQGSIYLYKTKEIYYKWSDLSTDYYTKSATPSINDIVYSDTTGTNSGYTISAYDNINNQITVNSSIFNRDSSGDVTINEWVYKGTPSIHLNGEDKTGQDLDFYAPTASGDLGDILTSGGNGATPAWAAPASLTGGYSPSIINDYLVFGNGIRPTVQNNNIIFSF